MPDSILNLRSLTRRFGPVTAVDGISLSVKRGEIFALLGSNGAGKTTTIKILTTMLPPSSGEASVAGYDVVSQATQVRRSMGYVPQAISVDGSLTGYENLVVSAKLYDVPRRERAERVAAALKLVDLEDAAGRLVRTYSGGMIRRLEIAQSTLHRPPVVFLDEPTIGLDPIARASIWQHVTRLRDEFGTTVFFTTHYMEEAEEFCDRIAIMHRGRISIVGTPEELKASVGSGDSTLDDVFVHHAGGVIETFTSGYRETSARRATARRLA
ncbi:MAG: ATP-binding cassette domain-containing protein [Opitutaceae bacterium]|nr:ATP-binding cassette domain-containing protein [Opitutaceae bacterium]